MRKSNRCQQRPLPNLTGKGENNSIYRIHCFTMNCSTKLAKVYKGGMTLWLSGIFPRLSAPLLKFLEYVVLNTSIFFTKLSAKARIAWLSSWVLFHNQITRLDAGDPICVYPRTTD